MADPEAAVGADRAAGPVARDRHVATAGKLGPGVGGRIVCPQVVEERRAAGRRRRPGRCRRPRPPRVRTSRRGRWPVRARSTHRSPGRTTTGLRTPSFRRARQRGGRCGHRHSPSRCGLPARRARRRRSGPRREARAPALRMARRHHLTAPRMRMATRWQRADALVSGDPHVEGAALQPASRSVSISAARAVIGLRIRGSR